MKYAHFYYPVTRKVTFPAYGQKNSGNRRNVFPPFVFIFLFEESRTVSLLSAHYSSTTGFPVLSHGSC